MAPLPVEVLYLIFPQLVQQDQLECMTVCRQWRDIIHDCTLFRFIYIDHQQQLDQLIERVKRDPFLGENVERLTVQFKLKSDYDAEILIEHFPNLRELALINTNGYSGYKSVKSRRHHPWCKSIEKIVERSDQNIGTLLRSGLCKNLTYIAMAGHEEESGSSIIEALANAPVLKTLEMNQYVLSFKDLEALHESLPLLESLSLHNVEFDPLSTPYNIKPATSIKVFRCTEFYYYSSYHLNPHLLYIGKKYTHLEELALKLVEFRYPSDEDEDDDEEEVSEVDALNSHKARFIAYMATLAPQLKSLSLDVYRDKSFHSPDFGFKILDECGCKIRSLKVEHGLSLSELTHLGSTMQAHNIQSLTLAVDGNPESILKVLGLGFFTALKELTLQGDGHWRSSPYTTIDLDALLTNVRGYRLEALRLYYSRLIIDDNKTIAAYASLKELILCGVTFPKDFDAFVARAFPNVRRLKLGSSFTTPVTFQFPNLDLSYLKIINGFTVGDPTVLVITLNDNQRRLYSTRTKEYFVRKCTHDLKKRMFPSPFVSSKPFDESTDIPKITIVCKSVFDFVMINFESQQVSPGWYLPQT